MTHVSDTPAAGTKTPRRLFVYNGGFLTQTRIRRILKLSGWEVRLGRPGAGDRVGVWGKSPTSPRGEAVAQRAKSPILRVEDAFLRSVQPGRNGEPPLGLLLDKSGVHFDASSQSDLEVLLATHPLDDTVLLDRARDAMDRMQRSQLSKYNNFDPGLPVPRAPYVLIIDQTRGDASVTHGGGSLGTFREMMFVAQDEHPGAQIVIKTHPETAAGHRGGHYSQADASDRITVLDDAVSPWRLMQGAQAVYTVSSGLGFEAILAGHKPRVFGHPFYAGWGLTQDETPVTRRQRRLTRAQLFAAAMILYPTWYDPYRDALCGIEQVMDTLEAQARAWREDRNGYVAGGMRLWKRRPLGQMFGRERRLVFRDDPAKAVALARRTGRDLMVWAGREGAAPAADDTRLVRIEDGFLRSRGLGAELVPPLSLVTDDLGIYYDPTRESRLERLIAASVELPNHALRRADRLIAQVIDSGVTKYNQGAAALADLPPGRRILVPGQVEDDASVRLGGGEVPGNQALLARCREANPDAVIIYKPHPDVEAGLRAGAVDATSTRALADIVAVDADPAALLGQVDEVWTLTSLMGFEALIRGKQVTTLGAPFYAGWGLTHDLAEQPSRRTARPSLSQIAHAVLIDYPRYLDPVTGLPCPPEVVAERLATGQVQHPGRVNRLASKLQGLFASWAPFWR